MCWLKKKRAQSSVEFVLISGVMFLVFIGMFMVLQGRISGAYKDRIYNSLDELGNIINSEIRLAESSQGVYSRSFFVPEVIEGYNYSIEMFNNSEIAISISDYYYVLFLDKNVTGNISKGWNTIFKVDYNVSLNVNILVTCTPNCSLNCGQLDGCGNFCPDTDAGTGYFNDCDSTDVCDNIRTNDPYNMCALDSDISCNFETNCTDGIDEDCDGLTDCLGAGDPDCGCGTSCYRRVSQYDNNSNMFVENVSDTATCFNDECVFNGALYNSSVNVDTWEFTAHPNPHLAVDGDTNLNIICNAWSNFSARWGNPDYAQAWCLGASGQWNVSAGDADVETNYFTDAHTGDSVYCNRDRSDWSGTPSLDCCCGDDRLEFYISNAVLSTDACCDDSGDCVDGSNICRSGVAEGTLATCTDTIDSDCDGTTDCSDSGCTGISIGLCRECDGIGGEQMPADDSSCGTIDCSGWYVQSGTQSATTTEYCYNKQDISTNRCEALGNCKDANSADCNTQSNDVLKYSCGTCKYISAASCRGTNLGSCSNYAYGTACGSGFECDMNGNCIEEFTLSYWQLNNNVNDAWGVNHGVINGNPQFVAGKHDQGLKFDGIDDHVRVAENNIKNIEKGTLAVWVKRDSGNQDLSWANLFAGPFTGKQKNGFGYQLLFGFSDNTNFYAKFLLIQGGSSVTGKTTILANSWTHLAATWDGVNLRIYVNGSLDNTASQTKEYSAAYSADFTIGAWIDDGDGYFRGTLDDVQIFSKALTQSEIIALMNE